MTDQIQKLAPLIWSEVQKARKILLCCHVRPDPDSVSSILAMKLGLEKVGKTVIAISGDDPMPESLKFLPGSDQILELDFGTALKMDFDLFVSLDSGDLSRITSKTELKAPLPIKTVVIDHHPSNPGYGAINLVEEKVTSTSELIYHLIKSIDPSILDKKIATCLYAGIWSDSLGLRSKKVTPETFDVIGELLGYGIDIFSITQALVSIKTKFLRLMGKGFSDIKQHFQGKLALIKIPLVVFEELGITKGDVADAKEVLSYHLSLSQEACLTSLVYEYLPGKISVSLRSNNPADLRDVSKIAKQMGGGGHFQASAAKFSGAVDEAEKLLLNTIQEVYPDLGQP